MFLFFVFFLILFYLPISFSYRLTLINPKTYPSNNLKDEALYHTLPPAGHRERSIYLEDSISWKFCFCQELEERGFTSAVGPHDAGPRTRAQAHAEVMQDGLATQAGVKPLHLKSQAVHPPPPVCKSAVRRCINQSR